MKSQLVSVIVTVRNEADVIEKLFRSIKQQSYKRIEIILIDNNSNDRTIEIAKFFTKKIYDKGPERSAQRNFGAQKSKGEYLLFLDADMELTQEVIKECIDKMRSQAKIGALIIPEKSIANNFWEKVKAFERSFYNLEGDNITDAARFFKSNIFEKIGGYDERITGSEDWDLTEKMENSGFLIGRIKSLINHYERIPNMYSLLKKKYYYGLKSSIYFKKQHIHLISPKTTFFLRAVFYKQWQKIIIHPILSTSMFLMLSLEMIAGGLGYLRGRR